MLSDALLHSLAATNPVGPSDQVPTRLPLPFQGTPIRIDQLAPAISYVEVSLVFPTQDYLIQNLKIRIDVGEAYRVPMHSELAFQCCADNRP